MRQNQSKVYSANYKGKNVRLNVKRLAAFGLSIALIKASHGIITETKNNDNNFTSNDKPAQFETIEDQNIALIEKIIKENPFILYDVTMETYEVKIGDTLSGIAENCGNTLSRICRLNNIDSKDIIYPGTTLKVEIIKEKSDLDKRIAALESYIHNYVFSSPIVEMARTMSSEENSQMIYYKSIIYGNPKDIATIDSNSLYGMYVTSYLKFHEKNEITDEDKKEYISILTNLAVELESKLNLDGTISNIVPYEKFYVYLQNRTTEYDDITSTHRSIYN